MPCISCGKEKENLYPIPSTLAPDLEACGECMVKYGADNLAGEADRLLAVWQEIDRPRCLTCGAPTLTTDEGNVYMYCSQCYRELLEDHKCKVKKLNS